MLSLSPFLPEPVGCWTTEFACLYLYIYTRCFDMEGLAYWTKRTTWSLVKVAKALRRHLCGGCLFQRGVWRERTLQLTRRHIGFVLAKQVRGIFCDRVRFSIVYRFVFGLEYTNPNPLAAHSSPCSQGRYSSCLKQSQKHSCTNCKCSDGIRSIWPCCEKHLYSGQ